MPGGSQRRLHVYEDPDRRSIALVSDRFRTVILEAGFTGADFLWKQDAGKFRSRQYFSMFLTDPLDPSIQEITCRAGAPGTKTRWYKWKGRCRC